MQDEEELKQIVVTAQKLYPGRSWEQLNPEEQKAVYASYRGQRDQANNLIAQGANTARNANKMVGDVYVQNPWEHLAAAVQTGMGHYQLGKANRNEAVGRKGLADLQTRRDAMDREYDDRRAREEEERRYGFLSSILGR
jgi:hypothetical protein